MKPKAKEEILKWMDKNIGYANYYSSVEYEKREKRILTENKGMNCILKLHITGLTLIEQEEVLKQLELIKDKVYPNLNIDKSILKHSPNWISINQEIDDINKAMLLLECIQSLHINHMYDDYYEIYEDIKLQASLEYSKEWIIEGVDHD